MCIRDRLTKANEDLLLSKKKAHLDELREQKKNIVVVDQGSAMRLSKLEADIKVAEADIAKEERKLATARMTTADKRALQEKEVNRLLQEREKLVAETNLKGYTDFMDVDKMQKLDRSIKTAKETLAGFDKEVKKATFSGEVDSARALSLIHI